MICRRKNIFITEMSKENKGLFYRDDASGASAGRPAATKQNSLPSFPKTTMPFHLQKLIDIEPKGKFNDQAIKVSKLMTKLLRHGVLPREEDASVDFKMLAPMFYPRSWLCPAMVKPNVPKRYLKKENKLFQ